MDPQLMIREAIDVVLGWELSDDAFGGAITAQVLARLPIE